MMNNDILSVIQKSNNIGITFHVSPDGDALGSTLGLLLGLIQMNKNVYIMSKENLPSSLSFLPYSNLIVSACDSVKDNTDCVIVLDCGNVKRINANLELDNRKYILINIDHHLSNDQYGDLNYVDTEAAAVGEIIFDLLKELNINIDKNIAVCLYTSILTDTGSFKYPSTTIRTHNIAGKLISKGIDFNNIYKKIYENKPFSKVKLYGKVIDTMEMHCNSKACFMYLTKNMLNELNLEDENSGDVISFGTIVDSTDVTVLIKETENGTKVSLRSKYIIDVRRISEYFGGGGHTRAAGFSTNMSMEQIKLKLIEILNSELIK